MTKTTKENISKQTKNKRTVWALTGFAAIALAIFGNDQLDRTSGTYEPYKPGEHPGMIPVGEGEARKLRSQLAALGYICPPPAYIVKNLRTNKHEVFCNSKDVFDLVVSPDGKLMSVD